MQAKSNALFNLTGRSLKSDNTGAGRINTGPQYRDEVFTS